jgi:hypothetical protein
MLTYDVGNEILHGDVGNQHFFTRAFSGGGRSRYRPAGEATLESWNSKRESRGRVRGGPLPPGTYKCLFFEHLYGVKHVWHNVIRLDPILVPSLGHRGGFLIHGSGPLGSDGCIVPQNEAERMRLNKAVKENQGTMLRVINPYLVPEGRTIPENLA